MPPVPVPSTALPSEYTAPYSTVVRYGKWLLSGTPPVPNHCASWRAVSVGMLPGKKTIR